MLIIKDSLAKNWLQDQLKMHQYIFHHSFNTVIVKVSVTDLFEVLNTIFDTNELAKFMMQQRKGKPQQTEIYSAKVC